MRRTCSRLFVFFIVAALLISFSDLKAEASPSVRSAHPLTRIVAVEAGWRHTCAITKSGGVQCWGDNNYGQLGNGANTASNFPVGVALLSSGVSAIAAGGMHTCALTEGGGVKCWGHNEYGQLGNGDDTDSNIPVDVAMLSSGVSAISAGFEHTCALTDSGGVKCWGHTEYGQVGNGANTDSNIPVDVALLSSGVSAIAAGWSHTCALTDGSGVKCWGDNSSGRLGDGTYNDSSAPVDVVGLSSGARAITAGGMHTCALMDTGGVKCWGENINGQLGNSSHDISKTPVDVIGLSSQVSTLTTGSHHTCALTEGGGVKCWGGNLYGQLGNGTTTEASVPVDVTGLSNGISAISAGDSHTCALTDHSLVECWGRNSRGQLGNGYAATAFTATNVNGLTEGVRAIVARANHTCALTDNGGVKCLGNYKSSPVDVAGLTGGVKAIAAGVSHTCAVTESGGAKCWGVNLDGQLGDGPFSFGSETPVDVAGLSNGVSVITAGWNHTCALLDSGGVKCWGNNERGQLGNGTTTNSRTPVDVAGISGGVSAIAASYNSTCILKDNGSVQCWGNYNTSPVDIAGLESGISAISAGGHHICVLTDSGGVKCWGYNSFGELGNDTTSGINVPVDVVGLSSGVIAIVAGDSNTCAASNSGVKCWGNNSDGQLCNGTKTASSIPLDIPGITGGVVALAGGESHTCALTISGGVQCWGYDHLGETGNHAAFSSTPSNVVTGENETFIPFVRRENASPVRPDPHG